MKNVRTLRKRRALSPVIATVIIVAVTITVAVAVSYWLSGIAGQYTSFEKIEIQSAYAVKFDDTIGAASEGLDKGWRITLQLQNTGTGEATLNDCFVNNMPLEHYLGEIIWSYDTGEAAPSEALMTSIDGLTLKSGVKQIIYVDVKQGKYVADPYALDPTAITFTSGTTINVKIHSAAGMDYIRLVQLP